MKNTKKKSKIEYRNIYFKINDESLYEILKYLPRQEILRIREVSHSFANAVNTCLHYLIWDSSTSHERNRKITDLPSAPTSLRNIYSITLKNNPYLSLRELCFLWLSNLKTKEMIIENCSIMDRPLIFEPVSINTIDHELQIKNPNVVVPYERAIKQIEKVNQSINYIPWWKKFFPIFFGKKKVENNSNNNNNILIDKYLQKQINYENYCLIVKSIFDEYHLYFQKYSLNLLKLRILNLNTTRITDEGLFFILKNSENLESLSISHCANLNDANLNIVKNTLKHLTVEYCYNLNLRSFMECMNLETFHVIKVKSLGNIFEFSIKNQNLKNLTIGGVQIMNYPKDVISTSMKSLTLHSLNISQYNFENIIDYYPELEVLHLINLKNFMIKEINSPMLKELYFSLDSDIGFNNKLPNLELLSFKWIRSTSWNHDWDFNNNLKTLIIDQCNITDQNIESILFNNPNIQNLTACGPLNFPIVIQRDLKRLDLSSTMTNDENINTLLIQCPSIEYLSLRMCKEIKNPINLKSLRELHISGTKMNCISIIKTLELCPNIIFLNISSCNEANDWMSYIPKMQVNRKMNELNISDNGKYIGDKELNGLMKLFPNLRKLHCRWNYVEKPDLSLLFGLVYLDIDGCNIASDNILTLKKNCEKVVSNNR